MKKIVATTFLGMLILFTACAQKLDLSKVPAPVKESFNKQFQDATSVKWEKEDGNYEASFKKNGREMSALFDDTGVMTESEVEIEIKELPATAVEYIKTNYGSAAIKAAAKIFKATGEVQYEAEVKGKDLIFDANGGFLKKE